MSESGKGGRYQQLRWGLAKAKGFRNREEAKAISKTITPQRNACGLPGVHICPNEWDDPESGSSSVTSACELIATPRYRIQTSHFRITHSHPGRSNDIGQPRPSSAQNMLRSELDEALPREWFCQMFSGLQMRAASASVSVANGGDVPCPCVSNLTKFEHPDACNHILLVIHERHRAVGGMSTSTLTKRYLGRVLSRMSACHWQGTVHRAWLVRERRTRTGTAAPTR
ncbi:hypothetical protein BDN71DRAFT_930662 [Pleurotus eryngii]|uniref:Uncharacterized protein n=1 Tax=Pleurotus eryngii TaxID=5323 RepID=A0A9P5ZXW9_PLEER|nr:hypothetical protein BDN71DRAFT_930662 [Pleurotus eryngii]